MTGRRFINEYVPVFKLFKWARIRVEESRTSHCHSLRGAPERTGGGSGRSVSGHLAKGVNPALRVLQHASNTFVLTSCNQRPGIWRRSYCRSNSAQNSLLRSARYLETAPRTRSMTDIPLRPLGRNSKARDGYTQLQGDDTEDFDDNQPVSKGNRRAREHAMPTSYKGKGPARSAFKMRNNEDEEEALLARDGHGSDEEERRKSISRASSSARSVCPSPRHFPACC